MKFRNGFVSNSSSSSFIILFKNIPFSHACEFESARYLLEKMILLDKYAIIFTQGSSGDQREMLVEIDEKIANYIISENLFANKRFMYLIEDFIRVEYLEKTKYPDYREMSLGDWSNVLHKFRGFDKSLIVNTRRIFDYSSIEKNTGNTLMKFQDHLKWNGVFDPSYAKYGMMTEEEWDNQEDYMKKYFAKFFTDISGVDLKDVIEELEKEVSSNE